MLSLHSQAEVSHPSVISLCQMGSFCAADWKVTFLKDKAQGLPFRYRHPLPQINPLPYSTQKGGAKLQTQGVGVACIDANCHNIPGTIPKLAQRGTSAMPVSSPLIVLKRQSSHLRLILLWLLAQTTFSSKKSSASAYFGYHFTVRDSFNVWSSDLMSAVSSKWYLCIAPSRYW